MGFVINPTTRSYPVMKLSEGQTALTVADLRRLAAHVHDLPGETPVYVEDAARPDGRGGCCVYPVNSAAISVHTPDGMSDVLLLGFTSDQE